MKHIEESQLSEEEVESLEKRLTIAKGQLNASNANWSNPQYVEHMERNRTIFFYEAGSAGVEFHDARREWESLLFPKEVPVELR